MGNPINIRNNLTLIFLGLIAVHLAACFFLILFPNQKLLYSSRLSSLYKVYALPGPFFKDELIRTTPHFFIRYKTRDGSWTNWRNPEKENFLAYHQHPWKYYKLRQSSLERHLARTLGRRINRGKGYAESTEFKELHRYFADLYLPEDTDSVSQLYMLSNYDSKTKQITSDTLFHLQYKSF